MSFQNPDLSNQDLQRPSARGSPLPTHDKPYASRNANGKRPLEDLGEHGVQSPRKLSRLDSDDGSEREESQQPSNSIADTSRPNQEQEFVAGPGHIIFIDERGKRCPAICFNEELVSRFVQIEEMSGELKIKQGQELTAQLELIKIESSNPSADLEIAKRRVEEAIKIREDIEAAIPELVEARQQYDKLARASKWSQFKLEMEKDIANFVVEQILKSENLLNVPPPKPQERAEDHKDHSGKPEPVPEHTVKNNHGWNVSQNSLASSTRSQSKINEEENLTPRQRALRHFRLAVRELDFRQQQFAYIEKYDPIEAANRRHWREQDPDRPESATRTDDDLRSFQEKREITRRVIEAEEAYDRAQQQAEDLGLGDILGDPEAFYWGEKCNDFPSLLEPGTPIFPADQSRIEAWMASVPDPVMVGSQRQRNDESIEVDDWEAKSIELFDSISYVARDGFRKKIDKWRELSVRWSQGEAEGPSPGKLRRNPRRYCRDRPSRGGIPYIRT